MSLFHACSYLKETLLVGRLLSHMVTMFELSEINMPRCIICCTKNVQFSCKQNNSKLNYHHFRYVRSYHYETLNTQKRYSSEISQVRLFLVGLLWNPYQHFIAWIYNKTYCDLSFFFETNFLFSIFCLFIICSIWKRALHFWTTSRTSTTKVLCTPFTSLQVKTLY